MRTAVVTGCSGFIGSAVVRELLNSGYTIWAVGHHDHFGNLPEDERIYRVSCGLEEIRTLPQKVHIDGGALFFHFAWEGSAGPARADTALQLRNVQWTADTLRAAGEMGCSRFIAAGSIAEDETIAAVRAQGNRPGPGYIYGTAKLAAHGMCMCLAAELGVDLVWAKITNAYGPGERSPRLVNTVIRQCLRGETPKFTAGTQNYDFVYIDDAARAFRLIGEKGKPFHEYLIGSSNPQPLKRFLLEMQPVIAPELEFQFGSVPYTGINLPISAFESAQTETDTGFRAETSFAEGCRRTMAWWKEQTV